MADWEPPPTCARHVRAGSAACARAVRNGHAQCALSSASHACQRKLGGCSAGTVPLLPTSPVPTCPCALPFCPATTGTGFADPGVKPGFPSTHSTHLSMPLLPSAPTLFCWSFRFEGTPATPFPPHLLPHSCSYSPAAPAAPFAPPAGPCRVCVPRSKEPQRPAGAEAEGAQPDHAGAQLPSVKAQGAAAAGGCCSASSSHCAGAAELLGVSKLKGLVWLQVGCCGAPSSHCAGAAELLGVFKAQQAGVAASWVLRRS